MASSPVKNEEKLIASLPLSPAAERMSHFSLEHLTLALSQGMLWRPH